MLIARHPDRGGGKIGATDTMSDLSLTILPETPDDAPAIEHLNARTFGPGRFAKTAYRIREEVAHIPELSFTARVGTLLVGSVRLSPILIGRDARRCCSARSRSSRRSATAASARR